MPAAVTEAPTARLRVVLRGAVQGVGFRPFVYRLATEMGLAGWVSNSPQGVQVEVEGAEPELRRFLLRLAAEKPPRAVLRSLEPAYLDARGYVGFEVRPSDSSGARTAVVLPDIATCDECLREVFDPSNRRYRYAFTNCTNCGPRFSILRSLPYDRAGTTMAGFAMCPGCLAEYEDPLDRRFHAQPNACPECGPQLALWSPAGQVIEERDAALLGAVDALRRGLIVAVKGLGGFHLMADARDDDALRRLRAAKAREEKPFALMFPSLSAVREVCEVSDLEARLLQSPEAPIVLLRRRSAAESSIMGLGAEVAPGNPNLGVMLPYTPLHHLLMAELGFPVVATSGNRADEPLCTQEREALERLSGIADLFLVHDRPIERHVDDSIVRVVLDREMVLRRARGYAPLPVRLRQPAPSALAVGAHLKSAVAVTVEDQVFMSQHLGDLETPQALNAFRATAGDLCRLYEATPEVVACDAHPDYLSTQHAESLGLPVRAVQHHHAHVLSCMAENELEGPVLGVSWDGTGYGSDGTIWGGEFLEATPTAFRRRACLRPFRLPGGERAVREPWRSALGLLLELHGGSALKRTDLEALRQVTEGELRVLVEAAIRGMNSPRASSAGRLFDGVSSLLGLRQRSRYEGQAAMELEFAADGVETDDLYPMPLVEGTAEPVELDWRPAVAALLDEAGAGRPVEVAAARFHNTLAEGIVTVARRVGQECVVLSGGCFQNRRLLERAVSRLRSEGFRPYWHQRVPPNDGGIALGQAVAAAHSAVGG